jgi:hypothetical protein
MLTAREEMLRELASYQECQSEIRSAPPTRRDAFSRPPVAGLLGLLILAAFGVALSLATAIHWVLRKR